MSAQLVRYSKFLSLVLRHKPETIGLHLDVQGWADIEELLAKAKAQGVSLTRPQLEQIVATNDKQRFALSPDGQRIRANQGHSIKIDLGLEPQIPPPYLYHGTATRFLASIRQQGLLARGREHVHLSTDEETARRVGERHGQPVVLGIEAEAMHKAGIPFYRSANGVWLVSHVPLNNIVFPEAQKRPS